MSLQAFHGDKKVKATYLKRVRAHALADEIIKGEYWEDGKGCAVGCTIHSSDHTAYERELGIPEWLARVEDRIFEGMSAGKAKKWPAKFLSAIRPGADLEKARVPFLVVVLKSALKSLGNIKFDEDKFPEVLRAVEGSRTAVKNVIAALRSGDAEAAGYATAWAAGAANAAAYAASAAAYAAGAAGAANAAAYAASAAAYAAGAARAAGAAYAAGAAGAAAYAAADAAGNAAGNAARAAAEAAAYAAYAAADAADAAAYDSLSEQLLTILRKL